MILRSLSWSALSRGLGLGSGLLVTILLARFLELSDLGSYYLLLAATQFGAHFVKVGMEVSQQRFIAVAISMEDWDAVLQRQYAMAGIFFGALLSVIALVVMSWAQFDEMFFASTALGWMPTILVCCLAIRAGEELLSAYMRSAGAAEIGGFLLDCPRQCSFALFLLAQGAFGKESLGFEEVMGAYIVCGAAAILISATFAKFQWNKINKSRANASICGVMLEVRSILILSVPVMLHGLLAIVVTSADVWVLGAIGSEEAVGLYGTVVRLAMLVRMPLVIITMVTPPIFSRLYSDAKLKELERIAGASAAAGTLIALPVVIVFVFLGEYVLSMLFGKQFAVGYVLLGVLTMGYMTEVALGSPGWLMQISGNQWIQLRITVLAAVWSVVASVIFTSVLGVFGTALASATSFALISVVAANQVWRRLGVKSWANLKLLKVLIQQ
jgi:O-antigen/teichoic acid export membrane protein